MHVLSACALLLRSRSLQDDTTTLTLALSAFPQDILHSSINYMFLPSLLPNPNRCADPGVLMVTTPVFLFFFCIPATLVLRILSDYHAYEVLTFFSDTKWTAAAFQARQLELGGLDYVTQPDLDLMLEDYHQYFQPMTQVLQDFVEKTKYYRYAKQHILELYRM